MTRRTFFAAAGGMAALLAGGSWAVLSAGRGAADVLVVSATADELVTAPGRLVVDIREPGEWKDTGVLPGARLHSFRDVESFAAAFGDEIARGDEIWLVCRSGNRSNRAARQLSRALDRTVYDVAGGMRRLTGEARLALAAPTAAAGCPVC